MAITFDDTRKDSKTENDMPTHSTSGSELVDMYFSMGASRGKSREEIENMFAKSYDVMPLETVRAAFYCRDVRQGQGERRTFRIFYRYLAKNDPVVARKNLHLIPKYGRWDDVMYVSFGTPIEEDAMDLIENQLESDCKEVFGEDFSL